MRDAKGQLHTSHPCDTTRQQALKKDVSVLKKAFRVVSCGLAALKFIEPMDHDFDAYVDKAVLEHQ